MVYKRPIRLLIVGIVIIGSSSCYEPDSATLEEVQAIYEQSCTDGVTNGGETGIDCGGPCPPCETCSDGILNQGETLIDCGGPCPPC